MNKMEKNSSEKLLRQLIATLRMEGGLVSASLGEGDKYNIIVINGESLTGEDMGNSLYNSECKRKSGKDRFPESGETGIFLIGNKVYIRKYIPGIRLELAPINGDKNSLFIDNIDDVHYFGRVLTVVRDT